MTNREFRIIGCFLLTATGLLYQASPVHAVAVYTITGSGYGFADLATNPNQFASWDGGSSTTLTYRFDASFTADNRIRNQVRLAFKQWDYAWFTNHGANDSYLRSSGAQSFGDIRSIMVHEIGHALYAHHPDVGHDMTPNRNYDVTVSPPVPVADGDDELMRSWVSPGAYNQILSHDELEGYDYVYGDRNLNFNEISSGTAHILITAGPESSSGTWAATRPAGVERVGGDPTQGWQLTSAPINFNTTCTYGMGYRTLGVNWDYQNPSVTNPTRGFEIRTRGTSNTTPVFHYDGSATRHFNTYSVSSTGGSDEKNDLLHKWSDPDPGDFSPSDIIHVGIEQDVWDWTVVSAEVVHPVGPNSPAPLLGLHDWNEAVTGVAATSSGDSGSDGSGIHMGDPLTIIAHGIRLVNAESMPVQLTRMGVAVVDGLGLKLEDLNREQLNLLRERKQFEFFDISPVTLDNGQELTLVLDGKPTGIGNPIFIPGGDQYVDRELNQLRELFVYVETTDMQGEAIAGNYALLGTQPITGVPEPGTVAMVVGAALMGLLAYARRRRNR